MYFDLTKKDSKILRGWRASGDIHTGIDIECDECYCPINGVVTFICNYTDKLFTVVIERNARTALKIDNLEEVFLTEGRLVPKGKLIGTCKSFIHVEVLNVTKDEAKFPTRIRKVFYDKVDPLKGEEMNL